MSGKKFAGILCIGLAMLLVVSAISSLVSGAGPALGDSSGLGVSRAVGAFLPAAAVFILGLWLLKKPIAHAKSVTEGGVYSIDDGDGKFGVVKILKLEPGIVHVRVYKNKFATRPSTVKLDELSLASIKDNGGFGMGHLPISEKDFSGWKAVLLANLAVKADELEGYKIWKEAGGGVFGK